MYKMYKHTLAELPSLSHGAEGKPLRANNIGYKFRTTWDWVFNHLSIGK